MKHHLSLLLALNLLLPATPLCAAEGNAGFDKLVDEAMDLLGQDKLDEALTKGKSAIFFEGKLPDGYLVCALASRRLGEQAKALEYLEKAIERTPESSRARFEQMRVEFAKPLAPIAGPLTGEVKRKHDELMELVSAADRVGADHGRTKLLREFMAKSAEFLELNDSDAKVWLLRAACSVELDYPGSGWLAGRKLKELGLDNSGDENTRKVLAALDRKAWLLDKRLWRDWSKWTLISVRASAEEGDEEALRSMGDWYSEGKNGLTKDEAEGVKWWRKSAEAGSAAGQYDLALAFANGNGTAQSNEEAVNWYRKSANGGFVFAQNNLGVALGTGRGVQKDDAQATKWYRRAAEGGNAIAVNNLGGRYEHGLGVAQDTAEAMKWYRKAAELGNEKAKSNVERLESAAASKPEIKSESTAPVAFAPPKTESVEDTTILASALGQLFKVRHEYAGLPLYKAANGSDILTGITVKELERASTEVAVAILNDKKLSGTKTPLKVQILPVQNDTTLPYDPTVLRNRITDQFREMFQSRIVVFDEDDRNRLLAEGTLKNKALLGADYYLTVKLHGLQSKSDEKILGYTLVLFQLVSTKTAAIVFEGQKEFRKTR